MPDRTLDVVEVAAKSIAINDPGERNKEEHLWGDRLVIGVGNVVAWIFPILMVAIVTQVIIRKFGHNQAWLDDAQWWMYGFAMLAAFGYAITTESHVRVDILHQNYSRKKKARIEVFGVGWLLMPFMLIMTDVMIHYGWASWVAGEGSDSANGLHMLYLLKLSLPVLFFIGIIASYSVLYRHLARFTEVRFWKLLLAALPFAVFACERIFYYASWWFVRLTNTEIADRRISREPLLEASTYYGIGLFVIMLIVSYILARKKDNTAGAA
ncbi:MAG: TRAP transporter small permease subunit [Lentilitoribacter sp.]